MLFGVLAIFVRAQAQFAVEPQAQTPEEYDAYLNVLDKSSPKDVLVAGQQFTHAWPRSDLCAHVYELEMEAYRTLNERESAIEAGEKALVGAPNNLAVLAQLAYILANSPANEQQVTRAEQLAKTEIEVAKVVRVPKSIALEQWEQIRGRLESIAHSALGMVAYKRGDLDDAIHEFETASNLTPARDPALDYRLGILYEARGSAAQAAAEFEKASVSKDPTISALAQQQLTNLRSATSQSPPDR